MRDESFEVIEGVSRELIRRLIKNGGYCHYTYFCASCPLSDHGCDVYSTKEFRLNLAIKYFLDEAMEKELRDDMDN